MSVEHLTDELIQTYLEDPSSEGKAEIDLHLQRCPDCRASVDAYRSVFSGLTDDSGFELSAAFASKVRSQLEAEKTADITSNQPARPAIIAMVSSAAAVLLAVLHYLLGWSWMGSVISTISTISSQGFHFLEMVSVTIETTLAVLNGGLMVLLMGGGILVFFGLLDRLLLRHRF